MRPGDHCPYELRVPYGDHPGTGAIYLAIIEKFVFWLIKEDPEELEEQADFDLLEERFLAYPALAITQSHTAMNGMAKKARKNLSRAFALLKDYLPGEIQ